jgi:hypothetical protein
MYTAQKHSIDVVVVAVVGVVVVVVVETLLLSPLNTVAQN